MKYSIEVIDNQVVVTNLATTEKRIHKFSDSVQTKVVAECVLSRQFPRIADGNMIRKFWKDAGDALGTSVANWCKMLIGASNRAYIVPEKALVDRFSYTRYYSSTGKIKWYRQEIIVDMVNKHIQSIKQYIDDGNEHLAAYAMLTGDTKSSKSLLGKGLWKQVCNTSKSRNDLIWRCIYEVTCWQGPNYQNYSDVARTTKSIITFLHSVKSTLIRRLDTSTITKAFRIYNSSGIQNLLGKIVEYLGVPMCRADVQTIDKLLDTINDTAAMRDNFNPNWSITRLVAEHAAAVRDQISRTYTATKFACANILTNIYVNNGYTAELLISPYALAIHSKEQAHCGAGYAHKITKGEYAVYMIISPDGKVSTLGISNPLCTTCGSDQHYYKFNRKVTCASTINFAEKVKESVKLIMKNNPSMIQKHN